MLLELEKIKQSMSLIDNPPLRSAQPTSAENLPSPQANRSGPFMTGAIKPSETSQALPDQTVYDSQPTMDHDDGDQPQLRPAHSFILSWNRHKLNSNKENQPLQASTGKRSKPGHQKDASHDLDYTSVSSSHKRHRPEDGQGSQDEGFQEDARVPKPVHRKVVPTSQRSSPVERVHSPPQMIRGGRSDGRGAQTGRQSEQQPDEYEPGEDETEGDQLDGDQEQDAMSIISPPSFNVINTQAKYATARSKAARGPQKRIAWSEADTQHLIRGIQTYATKWTKIMEGGGFDVKRDRVALKDRARNVKISFLK